MSEAKQVVVGYGHGPQENTIVYVDAEKFEVRDEDHVLKIYKRNGTLVAVHLDWIYVHTGVNNE